VTVQYAKYFQKIFKTAFAFVSHNFLIEEGREWEVAILAVLEVGVWGHSSSVMYGVLPPTVFSEWKLLTPGQ
jgi:hypothetical protein